MATNRGTHSRNTPRPGTELELVIDSLAQGGRGVARTDGLVVFVRGGIPGDRARCVIERSKKHFAEARLAEIIEPSADRLEPAVWHPGALWQVLTYERQLLEKQRHVAEAFAKLGGFESAPVEAIVAAIEPWRYRNRVEYSFGSSDGGLVVGFHEPGRFDRIADISVDILASRRVDAARQQVKEWCSAEGLSAYDRTTHTGFLRNLAVREGRRTGQLQLRLVSASGDFRARELVEAVDATSVLWTQTDRVAETTQDGTTSELLGDSHYEEVISGLRLRVSWDAFLQTNTEMAERLYAQVAELAQPAESDRVFDLFCGIGTIGLSLAHRVGEVFGIEEVEPAVADAIENARRNAITNASFFAGDVRKDLRALVDHAGRPNVVIVDPPRAGLSKKVVRRILETGADRIVYVSCNPTTLAPNASQLVEGGYTLCAVRPLDMFPQTPHIECVAVFERSSATVG